MAERRWLWRFWQAQLDPQHLVFLDETGAHTKMTRLYGRAARGCRVVAKVPHAHWKTTTFLGAFRASGFVAPMVIDGPINGEAFRSYAQQQLAPTLRAGDVVIMDNLAAHKAAGVREAIKAVGARLVYLPPYSPDLNRIELAFAKLSSLLRAAAERAVNALEETIGQQLNQFTPRECLAYFPKVHLRGVLGNLRIWGILHVAPIICSVWFDVSHFPVLQSHSRTHRVRRNGRPIWHPYMRIDGPRPTGSLGLQLCQRPE